MLGRKAPGIAHMRQAAAFEGTDGFLEGADLLFFAEALFAFGGHSAEKEACQTVSIGMQPELCRRKRCGRALLNAASSATI